MLKNENVVIAQVVVVVVSTVERANLRHCHFRHVDNIVEDYVVLKNENMITAQVGVVVVAMVGRASVRY